MNHAIRALILASAIFAGALAEIATAAPQVEPATRAMPMERHPEFRCVVALLQTIVDDAGSRGPQRLYIGPMEREGDTAFVRVYWPESRAILLIDWPNSCSDDDMRIDDAALGWYRTKARIDLDFDVVPTQDDIGGSTYLVDRPWVDRVIAACKRGYRLVIRPSIRR
jgi:hypothetical protein